ncbi:hypothetical protein ABJY94_18585 [Vibrio parahaemolyticus]|uniref:hypothetical protein n=1 Tax=Vibrio parahaemolyticus TaxID=670 RepID=UPI0032AFB29A
MPHSSESSKNIRIYKTKNFTVSVERHSDRFEDQVFANFKWVRIYANQSNIAYKDGSPLLLGCESGSAPSTTLIKAARKSAQQELARMRTLATQLLTIEL